PSPHFRRRRRKKCRPVPVPHLIATVAGGRVRRRGRCGRECQGGVGARWAVQLFLPTSTGSSTPSSSWETRLSSLGHLPAAIRTTNERNAVNSASVFPPQLRQSAITRGEIFRNSSTVWI